MATSGEYLQYNLPLLTSIIALYASFYFAWMYAVGKNDIADIPIDSISNPNRPLINGAVTVQLMENYNAFFLIWALIGAYIIGHNILFLIMAFIAAYYIYSVAPLRLKRLPIISTFLIGIAGLSVAMAGFLFWNMDKTVRAFPSKYMFLILIGLTLAANIKDLKDVEGDKADGILTIPVLFGKKLGTIIIAILLLITAAMIALVIGQI